MRRFAGTLVAGRIARASINGKYAYGLTPPLSYSVSSGAKPRIKLVFAPAAPVLLNCTLTGRPA